MGSVDTALFQMSRLSQLDVKWTGFHRGNSPLADYEHSNPYCELMMVTEGPVFMQVEDRRLELKSGDWLLLMPWERHTAWKLTHEQAGFFWVQFSCTPHMAERAVQDFTDSYLLGLFMQSKQELRTGSSEEVEQLYLPRHFQPVRRYELLNLLESLHQGMEHPQGYYRFRSALQLGQILLLIAEDSMSQSHGTLPIPASFRIYRQLVNLLNENYATELSRTAIEEWMDRKYGYLCQIFKKFAGMTIYTYIHHLRIQRAKYFLSNSELEIQRISESVGFQDPYYFSRLFKKVEHCSPTEYRRKQKKSREDQV